MSRLSVPRACKQGTPDLELAGSHDFSVPIFWDRLCRASQLFVVPRKLNFVGFPEHPRRISWALPKGGQAASGL